MSDENAPAAPAGWYDTSTGRRYWDGARWLETPPPPTGPPVTDGGNANPRALGQPADAGGDQSTPTAGSKRRLPAWAWIAIGAGVVVVLLVLVIGIGVANMRPTSVAAPTPSQTTADEDEDEDEDQEGLGTPAPLPTQDVSDEGTLANPYPIGSVLTVTQSGADYYEFAATLASLDAGAAVYDENQFNDPAPNGFRYVLVTIYMTGLSSSSPVSPGVEAFSLQLATPDGRVYQSASIVTPGGGLSGAPDLYAGQSFSGNLAFAVPVDASTFYLTSLGKYIALQ